jgi:peroxiredoxin
MRRLQAFALTLAIVFIGAPASADSESSAVAYRSPLRDGSDRPTSLAAAADHRTLAVVVMKTGECPVCRGQLAKLAEVRTDIEALSARVVGLTRDSVGSSASKTAWPVLRDPDAAAIAKLGLWRPQWRQAMPSIVVFDRCGDERVRLEGRYPGQRGVEAALLRVLQELNAETKPCGDGVTALQGDVAREQRGGVASAG